MPPPPISFASPSNVLADNMPLGNGELTSNAWVNASDGALSLLLGRSDAWSSLAMPIKVGRIKLRLRPSPFVKPDAFSQTLHLENGSISIFARRGDLAVSARLWVDSAAGVRPHTSSAAVVFVELNASAPVAASVALDLWRGVGVRNATVNFTGSCYSTCTKWQLIDGDTIASPASLLRGEVAAWAVRNTRSFYRRTLDDHMLGALANSTIDPLLHRTSVLL